jgi:general secretion pathway protein F
MRYSVKSLAAGGIRTLNIDALSEDEARARVEHGGARVLSVRASRLGVKLASGGGFALMLFSQELLALLEAGLSLVEALETLEEKEHRGETKTLLSSVLKHLYQGESFANAIAHFSEAFPPLYVATVRASERTGDLSPALTRYVAYQNQVDSVKKRVVSASIYPVLLLVVGGLVVLFLLGYVVPRFAGIYEDAGRDLPFLSRLLLLWGLAIQKHGLAAGVAFLAALGGLAWAFRQPWTRKRLSDWAWKLPVLGEKLKVYRLARFYRTLGMLLTGGIPVVQAAAMVAPLLHAGMRAQLALTLTSIREGQSISQSFESHGLTTPVALRMLRVGEKSGRMGEMMERIAAFYDEELARWVDWFTRLFEPLLMAAIGIMIGVIVVLMYLPIFELAGSFE